MKIKARLMLLALAAGSVAFQFGFGSCGRFWGDTLGDLLWLQVID